MQRTFLTSLISFNRAGSSLAVTRVKGAKKKRQAANVVDSLPL
jgi:hypothetical protein